MANFFSKTKVQTGTQEHRNKFDLSCDHITTMDFFQPRVTYCREIMPRESFKMSLGCMCRLAPMAQPFFGSAKLVNRAFFVPMRTLFEGWAEFLEDTNYSYSARAEIIQSVTKISMETIVTMFTDSSNGLTEVGSASSHDFSIGTSSTNFYKFTSKGKQFFNILVGLGYKFRTDELLTQFSALPILAYVKVYHDCFANSAYPNYNFIDYYTHGRPKDILNKSDLFTLLDLCYLVNYRQDYFTANFDNPTMPNDGTSSMYSMPDINDQDLSQNNGRSFINSGQTATTSFSSSPQINQGVNTEGSIRGGVMTHLTQYAVDTLHKLSDYMRRKQFVGSRALDRYAADYGVELSSEKLNRVKIISKQVEFPLVVSDVMQTSPDVNEGSSASYGVGNYSGKGIIAGSNFLCDFDSDEFGFAIVISYVEPRVSYLHGRPRYLQHIDRLSFFNGDFDGLGTQATRYDELVSNGFSSSNQGLQDNAIFGWLPRYAEYKAGFDNLSGDFLIESKKASLDGWLLYRDFSLETVSHTSSLQIKHDLDFTLAKPEEFENIFVLRNTTSSKTNYFDHFYMYLHFDVSSYMPAKVLFDNYDFDSDGRQLEMTINGSQVTD